MSDEVTKARVGDDWEPISVRPPDELFEVVSSNGTREAALFLWQHIGSFGRWKFSHCVIYSDNEVWWPSGTTHWRRDFEGPK